jgi:hypothetical protein
MKTNQLAFQAERNQWNQPMSPVSIPSPRKSATTATTATTAAATKTLSVRDREYIEKQLLIEADKTPFDRNNERIVMRDGKRMLQWVEEYGFTDAVLYDERELTTSECEDEDEDEDEDQNQEYYEGEDECEGENEGVATD